MTESLEAEEEVCSWESGREWPPRTSEIEGQAGKAVFLGRGKRG